jgi:hypothetical protein
MTTAATLANMEDRLRTMEKAFAEQAHSFELHDEKWERQESANSRMGGQIDALVKDSGLSAAAIRELTEAVKALRITVEQQANAFESAAIRWESQERKTDERHDQQMRLYASMLDMFQGHLTDSEQIRRTANEAANGVAEHRRNEPLLTRAALIGWAAASGIAGTLIFIVINDTAAHWFRNHVHELMHGMLK